MNKGNQKDNIIQLPELLDQVRVFRNRRQAGEVLARMLEGFRLTNTLILAIPSGGVPVAVVIAEQLQLPLDIAVVSKITLPWNTEAGYGAVAFDGTMRLNQDLLPHLRLTEKQLKEGRAQTFEKVRRRLQKFRGDQAMPDLRDRKVILVDDGLASGFTLLVAVEAVRKAGAESILVAVPTGSYKSVLRVSRQVETLYCANIRAGWSFAVAEAYQRWTDVEEEEALSLFQQYQRRHQP